MTAAAGAPRGEQPVVRDSVAVGLARVDTAFAIAVRVLRALLLGVAWITFFVRRNEYVEPWGAAAILVIITAWTVYLGWRGNRRPPTWIIVADVAIACAALLATRLVDDPARIAAGAPTVPTLWVGATVAYAAIWTGWRGGLLAAAITSAATLAERGDVTSQTLTSVVLLFLMGLCVGYLSTLVTTITRRALVAEQAYAAAESERALLYERERMAGDIHDGVLQLLAVVGRMDPDVVLPDGSRLGPTAAEQAAQLRVLIGRPRPLAGSEAGTAAASGRVDVLALLPSGPRIHVAAPAGPVLLPVQLAEAVAAITQAAVDNSRLHVGLDCTSWIALDVTAEDLHVQVRDDGPALDAGHLPTALARAEEAGRLGVRGMRRRAAAVGGRLYVDAPPGSGVEVTFEVPLVGAAGPGPEAVPAPARAGGEA